MTKSIYAFISFLFLFIHFLQGQQTISISKQEMISKVLAQNASIMIADQEHNLAKADYKQTEAVYLPNITASYTGLTTTNPLMAFGSKLNQELLTQNDFNPALLNDPNRTSNFATKLEIQQPIYNADAKYQRKAAKTKMEAMSLQTLRTKDYLEFEVEKAYMQLQLAYRGVSVIEIALETAKQHHVLAENGFKQGFLPEQDVLSMRIRVTEVQNQLQSAKSNVANASNYLSFLMNDQLDVIYQPADSLILSLSDVNGTNGISENRSDIKAMFLASSAYETMLEANKKAFLPRLNAFGSYELYDNKLLQAGAGGYLVGLQLKWNIFDGSRSGKIQKSSIEVDKSKLQYQQFVSQNNLELNKANRLLLDAQNKLKLTELALEHSKESLRIRTNRFKEGLEKTTDLLMADTQYAQKQLEYFQTIYEYNFAQAYLQFLTKE